MYELGQGTYPFQQTGYNPLTQPGFGITPEATAGFDMELGNIDELIGQLSGMFPEGGRAEYLTPFRTAGMGQIGRGVSAANRAIASRLAASGMGDSGIATSAIGGTYAAGEQAMAQLYSGLASAGVDYDRLRASALAQAAGLEAQKAALKLEDFETREQFELAREQLEANIMLAQTQMAQQQYQWEESQPNTLTEILNMLLGGFGAAGALGWNPFATSTPTTTFAQ